MNNYNTNSRSANNQNTVNKFSTSGEKSPAPQAAPVSAMSSRSSYQSAEQERAAAKARAAAEAAQRRAQADAAYKQNLATLQAGFDKEKNLMTQNYQSVIGQLTNSYNSGVGTVNKNSDGYQQEAYISYMLSKRDMPQELVANGITGGAAESTIAGIANGYGKNRNTIDTQRADSLAELLSILNGNKAGAERDYNETLASAQSKKTQYELQFQNNLTKAINEIIASENNALATAERQYQTRAAAARAAEAQAAAAAAAKKQSSSKSKPKKNYVEPTIINVDKPMINRPMNGPFRKAKEDIIFDYFLNK